MHIRENEVDITRRLRQTRADMLGTPDEDHYWDCHEAASHIELLEAAYKSSGSALAVIDGGFTRLYVNWDTAGTARYVKNAAAWLQNYERFGDEVVASATSATPAK